MSKPLNIVMLGTGYVGLVSGTCFAGLGYNVTCVDKDAEKIRRLRDEGLMPIYEPGLEELVKSNVAAGRLHFTTDLATTVPQADAVFIAVGTPQGGDGYADMKYVYAAAAELAGHLSGYTVIVDKSTVPVGTARVVAGIIKKANPEADFDVASNPEFLREGNALGDFTNPDRVVLGVEADRARQLMHRIYRPFADKNIPIVTTGFETAEAIKYAANAFLAIKIGFINEFARLCETVGADVLELARGIGLDSRIGKSFLQPGPGYGGSCFPKDTSAIARTARDAGMPLTLVEAAMAANDAQKQAMVAKITKAAGGSVKGRKVAVLGLAFKAETDDMRDSPALVIVPALVKAGATVVAHDPEAAANAKKLLPDTVTYAPSPEAALQGADLAVVVTEWQQYRALQPQVFAKAMATPLLVDLRNIYDPQACAAAGLTCHGLGRGKAAENSKEAAA